MKSESGPPRSSPYFIPLRIRLVLAFSAVFLFGGCAVPPRASTPSGNPEITLESVRTDCVRSLFINVFVNQGYTLRSNTDMQVVAGRESKNAMANVSFGTRLSGAPEERVTILLIPQPNSDALRIVISSAYVSNQGTAFESVQSLQGSQKDQDQFMTLASRFQSECAK
jgi:hypothetical protein